MARRGLRTTVTLTFAVGALGLSAALAFGTYWSARHFLVAQRERTAIRQAFFDAAYVRDGLSTSGSPVSETLGSISPPAGTVMLVHRGGQWYSSSLEMSPDEVPTSVQTDVANGSASLAWTGTTDPSAVVIGLPLPSAHADYFEVAVGKELDRTLSTLRIALVVCAAATTLAGALLGRVAARRLLAPLGTVTAAAAQISGGELNTRLQITHDPDLAALVGAFNNMVDALDERIQRDARFAADVSHELRSPVTTLVTSLSVLEEAEDLPRRSEEAVSLMSRELERFRHSLEDLLELGRLDAGVVDTDVSLVDLRSLVRATLEASGRSDTLLEEPVSDGDAAIGVRVDKYQVSRALINLFDNADIHGDGLTAVSVSSQAGFADVYVDDRGPGVDPGDQERIFERFARSGARGSRAGSGLGLSIVAQTIQHHGGSVWCSAREGGGTRFVVRLPAASDGEEAR